MGTAVRRSSADSPRFGEGEIVTQPPVEEGKQAESHGPKVRAAGRIVLLRDGGKLIFLDIRDWSGQIQLYLGKKQVGDDAWAVAQCFDLGDIIGVEGELKKTRTGELTIFVEKLWFLTKSAGNAPDKLTTAWSDPELLAAATLSRVLIHGEGVLPR